MFFDTSMVLANGSPSKQTFKASFLDLKYFLTWTKLTLYLCNNSVIATVRIFCVNSKEISDLLKILSVKITSSFPEIRTAINKHIESVSFDQCTIFFKFWCTFYILLLVIILLKCGKQIFSKWRFDFKVDTISQTLLSTGQPFYLAS